MRRENDQYFTPGWATQALLDNAPEICGRAFVECCVGRQDIARVLLESGQFTDGGESNDIDYRMAATFHLDATQPELWARLQSADWVVSNPPFNRAAEIIPKAYEFASAGIAMLLRFSYLEPCFDRAEWLAAHPPTRLIAVPRISFTGDGKTDNVATAWFIWQKADGEGAETANTRPIIIVPRPQPERGQLTFEAAA